MRLKGFVERLVDASAVMVMFYKVGRSKPILQHSKVKAPHTKVHFTLLILREPRPPFGKLRSDGETI